MSNKNTTHAQIQEIPLAELEIDIELSGRSQKEIEANAKQLVKLFEAAGGWSPAHPGQIFRRNGKPHLAAGFTRVSAAKLHGVKSGFFVEIPDDPAKLRIVCITSNAGKSISAFEQGRKYVQMRDGTDAEQAKPGEPILEPMSINDIAKAVGYTPEHIRQSILIFESPEPIAELIQAGKISSGAVVKANRQVKDAKKLEKYLKAAIAKAEEDGKETATEKHLDAVREKFAPVKAASDAKSDKPEKKGKVEGTVEASGEQTLPPQDFTPAISNGEGTGDLSLSDQSAHAAKAPTKKALENDIRAEVEKWTNAKDFNSTDGDNDELVQAIIALVLPF